MKFTNSFLFPILLLFVFSSFQSFAQVSISQAEILGVIGRSYEFDQLDTDSIVVNLGSPGANQTWDLRGVTAEDTFRFPQRYVDPSNTPYDTAFPQANFVAVLELAEPGFSLIAYNYWHIGTNEIISYGDVSEYSGLQDTIIVEGYTDTVLVLPMTYQSSWSTITTDTTDFGSGNTFILNDTIISEVDGWGTLKLPMGDFPCLRIKEINHYVSQSYNNGVPGFTDVNNSISYIWVSPDHFLLANADSKSGETDPNFTTATTVSWISTINPRTSLDDKLAAAIFSVPRVSPNPVTSEALIRFETHVTASASVNIVNLQGQKVATVFEGVLQAGEHSIHWNSMHSNGSALPNGLYLCTIEVDGVRLSQKVLLQR